MKKMSREEVIKSVEELHNTSWFEEIINRNANNMDSVALFFRGSKYTYSDFKQMVIEYANALKKYGIKKGDTFVACLRQTPDYPVLVAAASLIGTTCNLIAADFDKNQIVQLINQSSSGLVFVDDWDYARMTDSLKEAENIKNVVILPVDKWDKYGNPWKEITDQFFVFDNSEFEKAKEEYSNFDSIDEFLEHGENYIDSIEGLSAGCGLEDVIAITFTSGSTKKGFHKGVPQRNKTYIIMGRYHDPEVAGIPKMKNTITSCAIGPQADTCLLSGVSDTLIQGGTVALDPIIDEHYFIYSLKLNNSGLAMGTRTFWMTAMRDSTEKPELRGITLPGMYVPSEGGEPLSAGEEKALNKWLKKVKAGVAVTHTPVSVAKMTVGGGDSEHGSLFLKLYRGYFEGLQKIRGIHEPMGLEYFNFADVEVLRPDGTLCEPMEIGRIVANSPISMEGYYNDPEATEKYFITDAYGTKWGDCSCYGYKDKWENVYIKGRINSLDPEIKGFQIADVISRDTKNIMSCEVVEVNNDPENPLYVAHIEFQYFEKVNEEKALESCQKRINAVFGDKLKGKLLFRVHSHKEGFPTLFTAKRNIIALKEEKDMYAIDVESKLNKNNEVKKLIKK